MRTENTVKLVRFAGRTGRVVELNNRDNEVGVRFSAASGHDESTMWSAMSELEAGSSLQDHACAPIAFRAGFAASKAS